MRTRVGHSFIKAVMAETGAVFGGEHSGHFYFRDFWRADSGMLAALHVLAALGAADDAVVAAAGSATTAMPPAVRSTRPSHDQRSVICRASDSSWQDAAGVTIDELDGLTVTGDDWWFNVRASNTEPLLRLNVEATEAADDGQHCATRCWPDPGRDPMTEPPGSTQSSWRSSSVRSVTARSCRARRRAHRSADLRRR